MDKLKLNEVLGIIEKNLADTVGILRAWLAEDRAQVGIFLIAMGTKITVPLLQVMAEKEVDAVAVSIAGTDTVSAETEELVLNEYYELMAAQVFISRGDVAKARKRLEQVLGSDRATKLVAFLAKSLGKDLKP